MKKKKTNNKYIIPNLYLNYKQFLKETKINDENLLIKIKSIEEIEPEQVYDFETVEDTHSFIANSFYCHNCPVDSPEHSNIGLVKHLTLLSSICIGSSSQTNIIYNILIKNDKFIHINNHSPLQLIKQTKIFLNGEWIGMTIDTLKLYEELRKLKENGIILRTNSICFDILKDEIKIYTDSGRLYRPYLKVKNNKILLTDKIINSVLNDKNLKGINKWDALIEKYPETIDFVDVEEQFYNLVAEYKDKVIEMKKREELVYPDSNKPILNRYDDSLILNYTHCEFHPTMNIGIVANNIPFANYNEGTRNIFQYAQGRQAMGFYSSNYRDRLDISYILYNTQKPLVNTRISKYIHTDILPCGEQAVVAIACYSGYNQDDSLIFNQSSIDRGLFRSSSLKKWSCKIEKNQSTSQDDIFMKPDETKLTGTRHAVYDKLNDKGYVPEETVVENGDVIIGKVTPIQPAPGSNKCYKDSSEIYKSHEPAIIDKVFTGIFDSDDYEMIKIRTRSERIPKIGDKFCSRHGQKGVIGLTMSQSDMPFTKEGISPDIIVNPQAIPSRRTIAQLIECLVGKIGAITGSEIDGTSFNNIDIEKTKDILASLGYERNSTEYMYNGITGKKIHIPIFIGPTYYQRLKHLVMDKIHCLRTDKCEILTIQGWKKHNELTIDDLIATLVNNKLVYEKPKQIFYYQNVTHDMYHISNESIELDVTMKHRMWVSQKYDASSNSSNWSDFNFEYAMNLVGKERKYKKDAIWDCPDYQFVLIEISNLSCLIEKKVNMNYWIIFFGIWITDGWLDKDNNEIKLSIEKQTIRDCIFSILTGLDFNHTVSGDVITITDKLLFSYILINCDFVNEKYLPDWSFKLSNTQAKLFINSLQLSDGYYIQNSDISKFITSSEKLADQLQQLCLHAGYASDKFIERDENQNSNNLIVWKVIILKTKTKPIVNNYFDIAQNIQIENTYTYCGDVFCVEVNSGVFMIRQNGKTCWTANSRARGPVTMLTHQPPEGRSKDGGLRCGEMERDAIISHGMGKFLKERFLNVSDIYSCYVCDICGLFAQRVIKKENKSTPQSSDTHHCISCKNKTKISKVIIPYAFKLLIQELLSMNIAPRIRTKQYDM